MDIERGFVRKLGVARTPIQRFAASSARTCPVAQPLHVHVPHARNRSPAMANPRKSYWVAQLIRRARKEVRQYEIGGWIVSTVVGLTVVFLVGFLISTMVAKSDSTIVGLGEAGLAETEPASVRALRDARTARADSMAAEAARTDEIDESTAAAEADARVRDDLGEGEASFYGPGLQGNPTASGETFDMNKLTAAHRTLPLGSRVRVTNLRNNKSIVVRINDRGPYHGNRVIDLSKEAARRIGMIQRGKARVRLELLHSS
jgi:hypothetical protein